MPRFEDFNRAERRVIAEAMEWSQTEFYDPGHAKEDRDILHGLIEEIKLEGGTADNTRFTGTHPVRKGGYSPMEQPGRAMEQVANNKPTRKVWERPQLQPGEYAGFLYIECVHCDHIHAFYSRQPIRTYRCEECGQRTPLIDMYPLLVVCECGARFNYQTNIVTQRMDVVCYRCGTPVAVEWMDKIQKYQPMSCLPAKGSHKKGGRK